MIIVKENTTPRVFYGEVPLDKGYHRNKPILFYGHLLSFNWKYIKSFTVNGTKYEYPVPGIIFYNPTKVTWSAEPMKYCHLDTPSGEFTIRNNVVIGSTGTVDPLPLPIVFVNTISGETVFTDRIYEGIENTLYPIGIEVIPQSHDVYENGMSGIAGLEIMKGVFDDNYDAWSWGITRGNVGYTSTISEKNTALNGVTGDAYFATNAEDLRDKYEYLSGLNEGEYYRVDSNSKYVPSPYNKDGSRNSLYSDSRQANNACQFFDGKDQTTKIWQKLGGTATAVKQVRQYKTLGTEATDWYVPSTGEFGYIIAKWQDYLDITAILKTIYPKLKLGVQTGNFFTSNYWGFRNASTGYQMTRFAVDRGYHTKSSKNEASQILPFCMLPNANLKIIRLDWCGVKSFTINGEYYDDRTSVYEFKYLVGTPVEWSAELLSDNYSSTTVSGKFTVSESTTISIYPVVGKTEMPVVMYNKKTYETFYTHYCWTYPRDTYEPIGIVVIPKSHNVYNNQSVGIIGLRLINLWTPDTGGTDRTQIAFGGSGSMCGDGSVKYVNIYTDKTTQTDITSLENNGTSNATYPFLPTQQLPTANIYLKCLCDEHSGYTENANTSGRLIPSPYLTDGSRNPDYYTNKATAYNMLGRFDGKEKTAEILKLATTQRTWQTDDIIKDATDKNSFPVACATWRYHTLGTKQGDWYVPSCGEAGYLSVRRMYIGYTLETIKHFFDMDINLWLASCITSDQLSTDKNIDIGFSTGRCNQQANTSTNSINVPFTRMNITEKDKYLG